MDILEIDNNIRSKLQNDILKLVEYDNNVCDILDEYRQFLNNPPKINFSDLDRSIHILENRKTQFLKEYIENLLDVFPSEIHELVNTNALENAYKHISSNIKCNNCGNTIFEYNNDTSGRHCTKCFIFEKLMIVSKTPETTEMTVVSEPVNNYRHGIFISYIRRIEMKYNINIPKNVIDGLISEFKNNNIIPNRPYDIDTMSLDERRAVFSKITRRQIYIFLKQIRLPKYYEDVLPIHNILVPQPIRDYSKFEDSLLKDFKNFEILYNEMRAQKKMPVIHPNYILFQLLKKHNLECTTDDFPSISYQQKSQTFEEVCAPIFEKLGWKLFPFI